MIRTFFLTMCIAALACICGCRGFTRHEYPHELVTIDSLCDINSDEAITALKNVKKKALSYGEQDKWFYRLLRIKVLDKFSESNINKKEVSQILSYYEDSGCDNDKLSLAYYYMGRCYAAENNMPMSLHYYKKCMDGLSEDNRRLAGIVYFQSGYIFLEQNFPKEALGYFRKSLDIERSLNDTVMSVYCLQKIAYSYQDMKSDSCLLYFDRALKLANHIKQTWLTNEIKSSLATYYLQQKRYDKARELALPVLKTTEDDNPAKNSFYSVAALSCFGMGQNDTARYYFLKLYGLGDVESKVVASKNLYRIYAKEGNTREALVYLNEFDRNDDSLKAIKVESSIAKMNALYNYTMYKERNSYLETSRMRIIFFSVVVLILVSIIAVYIYLRARILKQRTERQILNLQRYRIESAQRKEAFIEQKNAEIAELQAKLQKMKDNGEAEKLRSRKKILESHRELVEGKKELEYKRKELFVSSPIFHIMNGKAREGQVLNNEELKMLDKTLFELMPDFVFNLKTIVRGNEQDIRMCALIKFCGLSSNSVALLLGRHKSTISKAKKKLLSTFAGSDTSNVSFEDFIQTL